MNGKTVILDGYSLIYRAFHGLGAPMSAPDGTPTNAVHGFMMMLIRVLEEEKPDHMFAAFDMHAPTKRALRYAPYKATRKPMPDELRVQVPIIRELLGLMGIPILEKEGDEADDILGTVSMYCEREGLPIVLVTGDRDSFQLSGEQTTILYTKKGITDTVRVTPEYLMETYGLTPTQMIDLKGLMGDTSDNIPGVPGVGEKTALKLMQQYGSLERVLETADTEQKGKLRERLMEFADQARLSRELATIDRAVDIAFDLDAMHLDGIGNAIARLRELRMNMVTKRLAEMVEKTMPKAELPAREVKARPETIVFDDIEAFRAFAAELAQTDAPVAIYLGADFYIACGDASAALRMGGDLLSPGVTEEEALQAIAPVLQNDSIKIVHDLKSLPADIRSIRGRIHDTMLAAYVLASQQPSFKAAALCEAEGIADFEASPACALTELYEAQVRALKENGQESIYTDIELPLTYVLSDMEKAGMLVDADMLVRLGTLYDARITERVAEIDAMAGVKINLNSPKQLGELLFDKLGLPAPKKTSRGYSTSAEVLEELSEEYPICAKILEYRKYQKLKSTYIDSLITLRDANGRVHSRFDQVGTATGRISSAEPNLQNIPVRTELGREIRGAFVAGEGMRYIDADYSQIELRVLAHISGDETMIDAFNNGQDIHARTASEVYGVPLDAVTHDMRSACKAVNFGIVYGISDFALAKNIGVSRKEAREFIDRYFERYPGIRAYMDESVKDARATGYARTLMGRRRYLPELAASNFNVRSFGERCAMNSPIQGTAADIIKIAMIRVSEALRNELPEAKLVLQVHDELIIEAPEAIADKARELLVRCMEDVISLRVPLKVEASVGKDWRECK